MGLFAGKRSHRPAVQQSAALAPREIPSLYPEFYRGVLAAAHKPVNEHNIVAIAGLTASNLALNAHQWLQVIGTKETKDSWMGRFDVEPHSDLVRQAQVPDEMIDFLWGLDARIHAALKDFVSSMRDTAITAAQKFGDVLPMDMWGSGR